jgi:hypothetical protein
MAKQGAVMAKSRVRAPDEDDVFIVKYERGGKPIKATQRKDGWTKPRRDLFLNALADTCNVAASCRAAGMSSGAIYPLRQRDPAFRRAWAEALREGYARLELAMLDRAINGIDRPVFRLGQRVDTVREYSDGAAMRLLMHHQAAAEMATPGELAPSEVAEARATIERRIKAIKVKQARAAEIAESNRE